MNKQNKPNLTLLKREIAYRARRSLKEMDEVVGRFIAAELDNLSPELLGQLRDMLNEMDQDLWAMWEGKTPVKADFAEVFGLMKGLK